MKELGSEITKNEVSRMNHIYPASVILKLSISVHPVRHLARWLVSYPNYLIPNSLKRILAGFIYFLFLKT
jgi:hypothetical protein